MTQNIVFKPGNSGTVNVSLNVGLNKDVGTVVRLNDMRVYLYQDSNADGIATVALLDGKLVISVAVKGEGASADAAIAVGHALYEDTDGEINRDATNGTFYGYALEAVGGGATKTINVLI